MYVKYFQNQSRGSYCLPYWKPEFSANLVENIKQFSPTPTMVLTIFSHYKSMGAIVYYNWKPEFWPIWLKNIEQPSPNPTMVHIKFDSNWTTGPREIEENFIHYKSMGITFIAWASNYKLQDLIWLPFLDSLFFSVLTEANKSSSSSSSSNNPPEDFGGAGLLS